MQEKEKGKIDAASFGAGYAFGYMTAVMELRDRIAAYMEKEVRRAQIRYEDYDRNGRSEQE